MRVALIAALAFALAWFGTRAVRAYAIRQAMLDIPNHRSSHSVPTPRGGGVAFVGSFLLCILLMAGLGLCGWRDAAALLAGGGIVAVVGWRDDRVSLPASIRFCWQGVAVLVATVLLAWDAALAWWIWPLSMVGLLWAINLFNFMDGIDGIAASEAVCFALGGWWLAGAQDFVALPVLAAACAGFACFNWPPAKIFMGDAGSGFLGLVLGLLAWRIGVPAGGGVVPWLILGGVFIADASYTLIYRMLSGQAWLQAHRSHAYQIAARRYGSHLRVTLAVIAINLLWLWPLAWLAAQHADAAPYLLLLAYAPMLWLTRHFRAGAPETAGQG